MKVRSRSASSRPEAREVEVGPGGHDQAERIELRVEVPAEPVGLHQRADPIAPAGLLARDADGNRAGGEDAPRREARRAGDVAVPPQGPEVRAPALVHRALVGEKPLVQLLDERQVVAEKLPGLRGHRRSMMDERRPPPWPKHVSLRATGRTRPERTVRPNVQALPGYGWTMTELPHELRRALSGVRSVGAIAGAGVSHESGIRTYRGKGGLYDNPGEGRKTEQALSGSMFRADPERTWRVIRDLLAQSWGARPNAGHLALARIEARVERFALLTQNVDGLHVAAGSNVIELHGDVRRLRCEACGARRTVTSPDDIASAPTCHACGAAMPPDVVLFGELLPIDEVARLNATSTTTSRTSCSWPAPARCFRISPNPFTWPGRGGR